MKKILSLILVAIMLVTAMPMAFAEGNTYKVGDIVQFGSYPQSEVKDETLIAELNALAPEWEDWTSYGYYSGEGTFDSMVQGDWMRYTDVTYNGKKYRGVKFTQYRPIQTCYNFSSQTHQDDNGYYTNTEYWFGFDPVEWRVLDPETGLVLCESILDAQPFNNNSHENDYETSYIRQWLNNNFYDTAFDSFEKNEISIKSIINDRAKWNENSWELSTVSNTIDKVFLLSCGEATNTDYGFMPDIYDEDNARIASRSDYAKCQGLSACEKTDEHTTEISNWWLRTSGHADYFVCIVDHSDRHRSDCQRGTIMINNDGSVTVDITNRGIRPALRFNDISKISRHDCKYTSEIIKQPTHTAEGTEKFTCKCGMSYTKTLAKLEEHNHIPTVTQPTCTSQGYTTFTCECGDTYKDNYVDKLSHKDDNGDYKCDYNCGYEFEKPAPEKPEEEQDFFEKIIEWLKELFDKLFGWLK